MTTPVTSPTGATSAATSSGSSSGLPVSSGISADFETFLKMLTTQAKYQDPLEPLDNAEYASQLAQFSQVEQQVQTNELLTALQNQASAASAVTLSSTSGWVGMEARAQVDGYFDGATPITVMPQPLAGAASARLVVRGVGGAVVDRIDIPVSADPFTWDGLTDSGSAHREGMYQFEVESVNADGEVTSTSRPDVYTRITETQLQGDEVHLILAGGSSINSTDVSALRESRS
ncbi:flagellar hook capping FlgD N-terminal domain-containing protein [Epibacterium ulvae]|uniref:flagellar hook capping FlgD N-terminal domain-containing protein n=1 Tax=Epibacterium ulvae TaxID=1156985 RepID=UPI0024920A7D|nr:flagellar hook capping FlgD N-terminal domain-containing protein [Epibacterium ulvae]